MTLASKFLSLSPERPELVFEQAAAGLAGQDVILERDFWVSCLLGLLFAQPALAPFLVFSRPGKTPQTRKKTCELVPHKN